MGFIEDALSDRSSNYEEIEISKCMRNNFTGYKEPKVVSVICKNSFLGDTEIKNNRKTWEYTGVVSTSEIFTYQISLEDFKKLQEVLGHTYRNHIKVGTAKDEKRTNHIKNVISKANEYKKDFKIEPNNPYIDNLKSMVDEWKQNNPKIEAALQKLPE